VQRGLNASGPIMGATTGWPRCGAVVQGRVILAGFRAAPQTLATTRVGNFSMLSTGDPLTADLGFVRTLDTDTLETINQIFVGQHVQIFTDSGEWYIESRTLDATQPGNFVLATRYGMKRTVRATFADGATIFVQKGGRVLRDLIFSDAHLSYKASPISLLAPHLLTDVIDVGHRPARSTSEGNQLYLVNRDGTMVFASLLREQEVVALTPWITDGRVKSVFSDLLLRTWLIVERESVNGSMLYLEKLDDRQTLDGAVTYDRGGMATDEVTGLEAHEGKEVWAWADGDLLGPLIVSQGAVQLGALYSRVSVGRAPAWYLELPKLLPQLPEGYPFRPPARIYAVDLAVAGTGNVEISVNGGPWINVNLQSVNLVDIGTPLPRDVTGLSESSATDRLEFMTRALCMIPSAGEHVYATELVTRDVIGGAVEVNSFDGESTPTFLASLGQANQAFPRLQNVSLFVTWFGDDLRCGNCTIRPKTDASDKVTSQAWSVSGVGRGTAQVVSDSNGRPAYGGTPGDVSVVQAIKAIADHGKSVTFTPFILMDVPAGNGKADPYGGASQAVYPWRGRVTCMPAPGQPSTVDLTATAAAQVASFMGTAAVSDFSVAGEAVTYTGPAEWSYRRFILHYAHLCAAAGGVDAFVIGSEMRGLSWVRSALGVYPFVAALKTLAADVRAVLGSGTKIVYAADWSEFVPHQTGVAGELFFHLDPLWSDANIDAIGIDNYWPLSDWRDGTEHADFAAGFRSIADRSYLQSNIWGGEGYDYFYASQGDRDGQVRTPITDGAYGEPWVWRYKDLRGWWLNAHHNRPLGVRDAAATGWEPQSKPIWFLEVGCPAVDKGANQPNVFYDPKSSESFFPYYSAGVRDDAVQRAYIEAMLSFFDEDQGSFVDDLNPASTVFDGRMVDVSRLYVYTWDARYFPAFPDLLDVYADGAQWEFGHWLTGRVFIPSQGSEDALPVGDSLELPLLQRLVTGVVRITGLRGFSRHPTIRLRQSMPAPIELRSIRYEVAHRG